MSFMAGLSRILMNLMTGRPAGCADELLERARKYNAKNRFIKPADTKAIYRVEKVRGDRDLLIVRSNRRSDNANCAVLFIFGAGGTMNAWKPHLRMVRKIVDQTGAEVFMPLYPLCTDAPVSAAVETAYVTYKRILNDYSPKKIVITGDSSGGAFCLALVSMLNHLNEGTTMPKLAILHSPSGVPHNKDAWERMKEQSKKDSPGILSMVEFFPEICEHGEKVPDYMIHPALGDYRNAPETYVYYSADETLASLGRDLENAYSDAGSIIHVHYEPGMIHCYSTYPAFKESKIACNEWMSLISQVSDNWSGRP